MAYYNPSYGGYGPPPPPPMSPYPGGEYFPPPHTPHPPFPPAGGGPPPAGPPPPPPPSSQQPYPPYQSYPPPAAHASHAPGFPPPPDSQYIHPPPPPPPPPHHHPGDYYAGPYPGPSGPPGAPPPQHYYPPSPAPAPGQPHMTGGYPPHPGAQQYPNPPGGMLSPYDGGPSPPPPPTPGLPQYHPPYPHPPPPPPSSSFSSSSYPHPYPPSLPGTSEAYDGYPPGPPPPLPPRPSPATAAPHGPPTPLTPPDGWNHSAGGHCTAPPPELGGSYQYPTHNAPGAPPQHHPPLSPPNTSSSYCSTPAAPTLARPSPSILAPRPGHGADPLASMASQFGSLSVNDDHRQPSRGLEPPRSGTYSPPPPPPKPAPIIRRAGMHNEVIEDCPEGAPLTFGLEWYHLPEAPDFLVCNRCYADNVRSSPLAPSFELIRQPGGVPSLCRFWVPRVKDVLWPTVLRTGDLAPLRAYAARRTGVPDCFGPGGVSADAGVKWFAARDQKQLPDFVACEACFEDRIVGTAFEARFEPAALAQRSGETWACDACVEHIARALAKFGTRGRNDWPACAAALSRRLRLAAATPPCQGQSVPMDSTRWFSPRRPIPDFVVCEACYLDKIALTEFEHEFAPWAVPKRSSALGGAAAALLAGQPAGESRECVCDMANWATGIAWDAAKSRHDFSVWWNAANAIRHAPQCTTEGLRGGGIGGEIGGGEGGTWYTLQGGCHDFDVCGACHAGIIEPLGLAPFFQPGRRHAAAGAGSASEDDPVAAAAAVAVVCDFNPAQARFGAFMLRLVQAISVGVFEPFESYVRKFAGVAPCQGSSFLTDAAWYGFADAPFCTDCYEAVAAGSALEPALQLRGGRDPRATMCCLYSGRMRQKWREACAAGSPDGFVAAARHRLEVYQSTVPVVEAMDKMKLIKMQYAMHQSLLAVQYRGMAGMRELSDATDGHWHRYAGRDYTTWEGAHAAELSDSSSAGMSNAIHGDNIMLRVQLLARWKEVE